MGVGGGGVGGAGGWASGQVWAGASVAAAWLLCRGGGWQRRASAPPAPTALNPPARPPPLTHTRTQEDAIANGDEGGAYEAYCAEVESTAAWGGQVELQALAQALRTHIEVYAAGLPTVELGEEFKGEGSVGGGGRAEGRPSRVAWVPAAG